MTTEFEIMKPDDEGWSDWLHPLPGFLMKCCDCGLVHEMEVAIGVSSSPDTILNSGETTERVVLFRMRRHEEDNNHED
jgi:hypothetical protein